MSDQAKFQAAQTTIVRNERFIRIADGLKPEWFGEEVEPTQLVKVEADETAMHGWRAVRDAEIGSLGSRELGKGQSAIADFGDHRVGYVSFEIKPAGSPPDAPLKLRLTFGEMPVEMAVPFSSYDGWISSSWLQEETIFVDVLPGKVSLPRRYSFRYLKIEVLDTSPKYRVSFFNLKCATVTSADRTSIIPFAHADPLLRDIDRVSVKTLEDCMQDVFEDGPKRDRRLWLGDLRLQALANYATFRTDALVKRCLYLFAGVPDDRGRVSANLFIAPKLIADDTYLFDYSLFFTVTLHDYYEATGDRDTLQELWSTARRQVELALERLDDRGVVRDEPTWWSFIDWHESLNKQAPSHAVLIYALRRAIRLAEAVDCASAEQFERRLADAERAAMESLWDSEQGFFVSGEGRQVSWAAQIWMALAEVLPPDENRALMQRLLSAKPDIAPTTPYMYHHLVEALLVVGLKDEAVHLMKQYWGGMLKNGADTFWELYDPGNPDFSPYGSPLINSYCHAWSCTPTYLIRHYGL
ncbi:sugar hydrolase [Cohnella sp. CIP 111063]|uniref:alpha-L-rhamnosidase-related protein n=1 Tax=unclassified Cohnella TaxID=2636738 RepID=UPI000B8C3BD1|nr:MULTISPECIES: family 78 glycoside hydrolase catalytic domain [unclassified Cohnella]OXS59368.1 sugar hydrolase [Cohnella sp. CIP 111063]PRX72304.1 alpha-L-rhamnosidase-like protein [Cohnella sp. SGD-V74]